MQQALSSVMDPELGRNMVDLGMVKSVAVAADGRVDVMVALDAPGCAPRAHFDRAVKQTVGALDGVVHVNVHFAEPKPKAPERRPANASAGAGGLEGGALAGVRNVICVGSGKGGVGKSTVTANLAAALTVEGKAAAALDADVWGYSIPRMLGVHGRPRVSADRKILPLEAPGGIKAVSIEHFLEGRDQAITWRGPMLHKAIRQFLEDVAWGELDYLLIDLPPGTGDVSMTLAQLLPQSRFVIVTTPQPAAQKVAQRAAGTAQQFDLEVAGVVENMSGFVTPSGERFTIFGEGGGQQLADDLDVPLLGKIPLQEELRVGADEGRPLVLTDPDAPASQALFHTARGLISLSDAAPVAPPQREPEQPAAPNATTLSLPMAPPGADKPAPTQLPMA